MFKILCLLFVLCCVGCATPPKVWHYPDFKVVRADMGTIKRICGQKARCCYSISKKIIWVDEFSAECFVNELCHQQGIDLETCERDYRWR